LRGDDVDLGEALFAPGWFEMLTEIEEAQASAMHRYAESARKAQAMGEGYRQLGEIGKYCRERMTEIVDAVEDRLGQLRDDDTGRRQLIAQGHRDAAVVSSTAVNRIHVQIRRILDLDENTAAVTVDDWLARHQATDE
jgi:hypothetical protein